MYDSVLCLIGGSQRVGKHPLLGLAGTENVVALRPAPKHQFADPSVKTPRFMFWLFPMSSAVYQVIARVDGVCVFVLLGLNFKGIVGLVVFSPLCGNALQKEHA